MSLFVHELRQTRKSLLIWTVSIASLNILCLFLFPEIRKQMKDLNALFSSMGAFSSALGMDQLNIGTLPGFFSIECGSILGLGGGLFAAILGGTMVSKEEHSHTADFLFAHPISRAEVLLQKLAALAVQIVVLNLMVLFADLLVIRLIGEKIPWNDILLIHLAYFLLQLETGSLCFSFSALSHENPLGLCIGITFGLYCMNLAANLSSSLEWLRWLTPYAYCEGSWIIEYGALNLPYLFSGLVISVMALLASFSFFSRKDLRV